MVADVEPDVLVSVNLCETIGVYVVSAVYIVVLQNWRRWDGVEFSVWEGPFTPPNKVSI
jgi:hypothetical protein